MDPAVASVFSRVRSRGDVVHIPIAAQVTGANNHRGNPVDHVVTTMGHHGAPQCLIRIKSPQDSLACECFRANIFRPGRVSHRNIEMPRRTCDGLKTNTQQEDKMRSKFTNDFKKTSSTRHAAAKEPVQISRVRRERERKEERRGTMSGQAETQTNLATRRMALPCCPRCDDLMFASTAAEFVNQSSVRHQWSCESCGHEFSTSVELSFQSRRVLS